jgi:hypothetical protein
LAWDHAADVTDSTVQSSIIRDASINGSPTTPGARALHRLGCMDDPTMGKSSVAAAILIMALGLTSCSQRQDGLNIPPGTDVTVQKTDGVTVSGKLVEVQAERVVLEGRDGSKTPVLRSEIAAVRSMELTPAPSSPASASQQSAPSAAPTGNEPTAEQRTPAPKAPASRRASVAPST